MNGHKDWIMAGIAALSFIITVAMGYAKLEEKAVSAEQRALEAKQKAADNRLEANHRFDQLDADIKSILERMPCRK